MAVERSAKISPALESRLGAEDDDLLDVVVELERAAPEGSPSVPKLREAFERDAAPVSGAISSLGGEVTDQAWLNRTLRAKVPASAVSALADHDAVALLDVPHRLTPE
jgi:hypothetical protein